MEKSLKEKDGPKICLIDVGDEISNTLISHGFFITRSSLGSIIETPNQKVGDKCQCKGQESLPANLFEYDIVILDLEDKDPTSYDEREQLDIGGKKDIGFLFKCDYPLTLFDQRPLGNLSLKDNLHELAKKPSILIVFTSRREEFTYQPIRIHRGKNSYLDPVHLSNYDFLSSIPNSINKSGFKVNICTEVKPFVDLFQKRVSEICYDIVFFEPQEYRNGNYTTSKGFISLLNNPFDHEEVISFHSIYKHLHILFLPQFINKSDLLSELLQESLPTLFPNIFKYSSKFLWLESDAYMLPNENKLIMKKNETKDEYETKLDSIEKQIIDNRKRYRFLHQIISETGEKLVEAVRNYLFWIGFQKVSNCDEISTGMKEEDLQTPLDDGLLVIEVKGISGTSKDGECSQISKIIHRRQKERNAFDVYGIYIVNHQRFLPPEERSNPPFTDQQIEDAKNEERGLLTTYQLFKLYFQVESGLISKEDVRRQLLDFGFIEFKPSNAILIGRPIELHYDGKVGIFTVDNIELNIGDEVVFTNGYDWRKEYVVCIKKDNEDVKLIGSGEIGIEFSESLNHDTLVWKIEK